MSEQNRVEAVERALSLLDLFRNGEQNLSLAALSQRSGLYKSTILRLLGSLERFGYILRGPDGTYRLGPAVWQLGLACRSSYDLESTIRPHLEALAAETGETAAFFIRSGGQRLCLYRINSRKPIRHHLDEGALLPLEQGASGRTIMAFSGAEGEPYDSIRARGYHISFGERDPDVMAIGVPIFGASAELLGVLSVTALRRRFEGEPAEAALTLLQKHAAELNRDHIPKTGI